MAARPVRLRPQVEREIVEAMAWYRDRSPGLEEEFYRSFLDALSKVAEVPEMYATVRGDVRRIVFRRFPYALFYVLDDPDVVVLSCLHERRSPDTWPSG